MDNENGFTKRLQMLLDNYNLSASGLANKIGIQRSTISHVISGRNKPSLDFVMKLLNNFSDVSFEWLINGKGDFPRPFDNENEKPSIPPTPSLFENEKYLDTKIPDSPILNKNEKIIDKVIILYTDGTFDSYIK